MQHNTNLIQSKAINQLSSTSISTSMAPKYYTESINTNLNLLGNTRHAIPLETKTLEKGCNKPLFPLLPNKAHYKSNLLLYLHGQYFICRHAMTNGIHFSPSYCYSCTSCSPLISINFKCIFFFIYFQKNFIEHFLGPKKYMYYF